MQNETMSYNRCACQKCGSQYATLLKDDAELASEPCPKCGQKELKIVGQLTPAETKSLFFGGG